MHEEPGIRVLGSCSDLDRFESSSELPDTDLLLIGLKKKQSQSILNKLKNITETYPKLRVIALLFDCSAFDKDTLGSYGIHYCIDLSEDINEAINAVFNFIHNDLNNKTVMPTFK
jgi:hypothetical protein